MKIAVNKCFGGFSLTSDVAKILREKGVKIIFPGERFSDGSGRKEKLGGEDIHYLNNECFGIKSDNMYAWRADSRLINAIEQVGEENAGGKLSNIVIVDIPDDIEWELDDYDGIETIHEKHRSW